MESIRGRYGVHLEPFVFLTGGLSGAIFLFDGRSSEANFVLDGRPSEANFCFSIFAAAAAAGATAATDGTAATAGPLLRRRPQKLKKIRVGENLGG